MASGADSNDTDLQRFYDRLVKLALTDKPESGVREALLMIIREAGAELGCIELRLRSDDTTRFSISESASSGAITHEALSLGILNHVISSGETYVGNALTDSRFADNGSVKTNQIETVIVVPIEVGVGAVYLQAQRGREFDDRVTGRTEHLAHLLQPLTSRLLGEWSLEDETAAYERRRVLEALARNDWNITATADELGVKRQSMYPLLRRLGIDLK